MTTIDPNKHHSGQPEESAVDGPAAANPSAAEPSETAGLGEAQGTEASAAAGGEPAPRKPFLIGSQRDPVAYRARQRRDWTPVVEMGEKQGESRKPKVRRNGDESQRQTPRDAAPPAAPPPSPAPANKVEVEPRDELSAAPSAPPLAPPARAPAAFPPPSVRDKLSPDLEAELDRAMGEASMAELMGDGARREEQTIEPESLQSGRVVAVRRDDVFVEFGVREQGVVSLRSFDVPPTPGAAVQVVVQRLNPEDGLYELTLPNKAVQVGDWSDLVEGALVEVRVTGHNTGGLECEVNHIRGFIPISQIALYRVEDLAPYVDQRMACLITEADPERRNLVLSRRAVLEREKEQAREQMLGSLRPGQVFDGVVRKLMDFGAFVELGNGVDGLVHISQLAWGRVKHPSDVLKEGQTIKVRVDRVDPETGKIGLAYRDLMESPWTAAAAKFPVNSIVQGTVTKLMEFGAFVELEPGIEGLVHISELSPKRVWRASDVVQEGQQVEVLVLSVDAEAQRMSLSMKALAAPAEPAKKEEDPAAPAPVKKSNKPTGPLKGGLGRRSGERFGLNW